MKQVLSKEAKEDLAIALILLRDFKGQGKMDVELTKYMVGLAGAIGVRDQYDMMMSKIPPMRIEPRHQ